MLGHTRVRCDIPVVLLCGPVDENSRLETSVPVHDVVAARFVGEFVGSAVECLPDGFVGSFGDHLDLLAAANLDLSRREHPLLCTGRRGVFGRWDWGRPVEYACGLLVAVA